MSPYGNRLPPKPSRLVAACRMEISKDFEMDVEKLFERVTVPAEYELEYETIYRNIKHLAYQLFTICPGKAERITAINKLKNTYNQIIICFNGQ